jgi:glycosyltransferase involved in cell wall biosynthesis
MAMGSFDPSRVTHLPYCLPARAFTGPGGAGQYLLFSGRVTPIKGIFPLLKAIGQVPEARLVLAGRIDGSLANELTRLLPSNAEYVGFKHGEELEALIAGATAVLAPSIWYENQPFSILEAFAAGRPVIASDLGALPELVPPGERGLLAPPHDIDGLAASIRSLLEQPEAARRWGENAFRYARAEHEPDAHYERLMRIYASVRGHRG